jgi:hypothetical protein
VNAAGRALYETEYARLRKSIELGGALVTLKKAEQQRPVLEQIIANGDTTLERAGDVGDPYLLSNTRMTIAAAQYDLANIEPSDAQRARRVAAGTRECVAAVKLALRSGTPMLPAEVLPWALVVLAGGLRAARGAESGPVQALMTGCANAIPNVFEQQKQGRIAGAQGLFQAQLLLRGAKQLSDSQDRTTVLARAAEVARDARRTLLGVGDRAAATQAKALLAEIERAR